MFISTGEILKNEQLVKERGHGIEFECQRCLDTGIWLTPRNRIELCPVLQVAGLHREINRASEIVQRGALIKRDRKEEINREEFDIARLLTRFSTKKPCPRKLLDGYFYRATNLEPSKIERKIKKSIERLLKEWLLPLGSRKSAPAGYWIITDLDDYKVWFEDAKKPPITRLSTIHKNARRNFPEFAEQMELEFWQDMGEGGIR